MTILKDKRPASYMPIEEVEYMIERLNKRKIFRMRTIEMLIIAAFVEYHDGVLYYHNLQKVVNERKFPEKPSKVSIHRIATIRDY